MPMEERASGNMASRNLFIQDAKRGNNEMKSLLLRIVMLAVICFEISALISPARAVTCVPNSICQPVNGTKTGVCGSGPSLCTCFFNDGTHVFDPVDCSLR
jgi:hypothetical protein